MLERCSRLLVATSNRGKIEEFRRLLPEFELLSLGDCHGVKLPPEGEKSFAENALAKARVAWQATGLPSVADDSGLEVDALGGAPGVISARYAGEGCTDRDNIDLLLRNLRGVPEERRTARFVCVVALVFHGCERVFTGTCDGHIALSPRGMNGFGYDPVFIPQGSSRTFGEMESWEKDKYSHRMKAIVRLRDALLGGEIP
ncbi:MAG: RdgB/HAM1 family non-canonical purine NTP pyrophosphatase [Bacillota bacterium]